MKSLYRLFFYDEPFEQELPEDEANVVRRNFYIIASSGVSLYFLFISSTVSIDISMVCVLVGIYYAIILARHGPIIFPDWFQNLYHCTTKKYPRSRICYYLLPAILYFISLIIPRLINVPIPLEDAMRVDGMIERVSSDPIHGGGSVDIISSNGQKHTLYSYIGAERKKAFNRVKQNKELITVRYRSQYIVHQGQRYQIMEARNEDRYIISYDYARKKNYYRRNIVKISVLACLVVAIAGVIVILYTKSKGGNNDE